MPRTTRAANQRKKMNSPRRRLCWEWWAPVIGWKLSHNGLRGRYLRRREKQPRSAVSQSAVNCEFSCAENFIDLRRQLEIQIADTFNAVGIQIDDHFVPDIEPLRMMVHRFGHQRHASHVPKGGDEVLALKGAVQLAIHKTPPLSTAEMFLHFSIGQFF